jgi:hypothetical protein
MPLLLHSVQCRQLFDRDLLAVPDALDTPLLCEKFLTKLDGVFTQVLAPVISFTYIQTPVSKHVLLTAFNRFVFFTTLFKFLPLVPAR